MKTSTHTCETHPFDRNHSTVNFSSMKVLNTLRRIFAGGHSDITETSYTGSSSVGDYFSSDDLDTKNEWKINKNIPLRNTQSRTLPNLEKWCFKSVARVDVDKPLTHKLRLPPLLFEFPALFFLSVNNGYKNINFYFWERNIHLFLFRTTSNSDSAYPLTDDDWLILQFSPIAL